MGDRKLGLAIIGLGGAVGTTIVAGIELITKGLVGTEGLPLSGLNESGPSKSLTTSSTVSGATL